MAQQRMQDLVGRLMIDKEFLAALVRDPAPILAQYDLAVEERAAILEAASRAGQSSDPERMRSFQAGLMKRWAT